MSEAMADPPALSGRRYSQRSMLLVLLTGVFVGQFDFFVVNVAAPQIEHDLNAGTSVLQLIVGGYAFAYASGMITSGRLGDMFGHRRLFIIGVIAFGVTSLLCGITTSAAELVAARLAQGLAGAVMVPQTMGMITKEFPPEERGRGIAAWGMAAGLGSIAGQVLGGGLVELNVAGLGWRSIFLVNVPICLVTALLAPKVLPGPTALRRTGLDPIGAVGSSLTLGLLLVPLALGRSEGWPVWCWVSLAAAVPVGVFTLQRQAALTRSGGSPVIDMTLFNYESFRAGIIACASFMLYFGSFMFTLTLLLQSGLGLDPFEAGLVFCPMGVFFSLTSMLSPRLRARYGQKVLVASALVTALGLALLAVALFAGGPRGALGWTVVSLSLLGLGNGIVLPALIGVALVQVKPRQAGIGTGVLQTVQQFASAAGVAVVGAVFFTVLGTRTDDKGYAKAMAWSATIDLVLMLAVTWMILMFGRMSAAITAPAAAAAPPPVERVETGGR